MRKNRIWGIVNEDGNWTKEEEDVKIMFYNYYASLFTITNPSQAQLEVVL